MIKISIKEPNIFYSYLDERMFFQWLESIDFVSNVIGIPEGLDIVISEVNRTNLYDLIALLFRYSINLEPLLILIEGLSEEDRKWFNNPDVYWHKELYDSKIGD